MRNLILLILGGLALLGVIAGAWWINYDLEQRAIALEQKWSTMSDEEVMVDAMRRGNRMAVSMGAEDIAPEIDELEAELQAQRELLRDTGIPSNEPLRPPPRAGFAPPPPVVARPAPPVESQGDATPWLLAALAGLVVIMLAAGGAFFWFRAQDGEAPPPPTA